MLIRKISVSILGTIPSFLWKNQSPKANNYLFKSYGLVSYKVDAYKKNKCLCFNFRHNSMFALKVLRAGILIKLTKSKEGKTKGKIIKGGPLMWKIGFYISAQKNNYIFAQLKITYLRKIITYLRRNYISAQNNYISAHNSYNYLFSFWFHESPCISKAFTFVNKAKIRENREITFCSRKLKRLK